jgi:hypothetical protein
MTYYTHPQEVWNEAKCKAVAKHREMDSYGSIHPYAGKVAGVGSSCAEYGQTQRYNGGYIAPDGNWYNGEVRPLPQIPETYEFYKIVSWGTYLRKKKKEICK